MMQPPPYGSSYDQLLAHLRVHVHDQGTDMEILRLLRNAVEEALKAQKNLVLSSQERRRLSQAAMKAVLNRMIQQVDQDDHA